MLSSKYRFHSRGGVRHTYNHGKSIRGLKLSLVYTPNNRNKQRFAVVISKKVLKSAVGRNRVRRRIYEIIRSKLADITKPIDCIFVVYTKELETIPFDNLTSLVETLLRDAHII